jgi:hypothetical protein
MKRTTISVILLSSSMFLISLFALVKQEAGSPGRAAALFEAGVPINISNSASESSFPLIGLDSAGAAYAIWIERTGSRNFTFATNGSGSWSDPENVDRIYSSVEDAGFPVFAVAPSGAGHLMFHDVRGASYDIYHLGYSGVWSTAFNVSQNAGGSAYVSCAVSPIDDGLFAVWMDGSFREWEIYLRQRSAQEIWGDKQILLLGRGYTPEIALDSEGRAHLAWSTRGDGNSSVWYSKNATPQVSTSWTQRVLIKGNTGEDFCRPKIGCDNEGNAYIIWLDKTAGNEEIFFRKVNGDGTLGEEVNVSQTPGASQEGVIAANRQSGHVYVGWAEGGEIYVNALKEDGWTGRTNLSNSAASSKSPSFAVDSMDVLHLVYAEVSGGNWEIMYLTTMVPPTTTSTTSTTSTTTSTTSTTTTVFPRPYPPLDLFVDTRLDSVQTAKINTLAWHRNPANRDIEIDSYKIYRKQAGMPDSDFAFISSVSKETFGSEDAGIPLAQRYAYRMTTMPLNGEESEASESVTEASLFPPLNVGCRTAINNSLFRREKINMISWQENPLNEDAAVAQYRIYRKRSDQEDSEFQMIGSVGGRVFEYQDRKTPFNERYYYIVMSVDADGNESRRSNTAKEGS